MRRLLAATAVAAALACLPACRDDEGDTEKADGFLKLPSAAEIERQATETYDGYVEIGCTYALLTHGRIKLNRTNRKTFPFSDAGTTIRVLRRSTDRQAVEFARRYEATETASEAAALIEEINAWCDGH